MKKLMLVLSAVSLLTITSCSLFSNKREKGTPIESTKTAVDALKADKSKEGKRYTITGYLTYTPPLTVYTNRPQTVYVYTTPGDPNSQIAILDMSWGEHANAVFLPGKERDLDKVIFYDNENKPFTSADKVDISFETDVNVYLQKIRIDRAQ
ncbi:hypothetical protein DBR32_07665 [Taibaiella sp. KBW10]|uniref:hypothetical protein n=1 Tax=Taibaiella sp. KBW10 TaxID=2153357 RepID=UPI000F59242C|nr:hypothetical protein [Taibaiella sp. KBW10]RQO31809.1 hypothetical protein DBR32_07665 [Taibaiella sp. KBW10]